MSTESQGSVEVQIKSRVTQYQRALNCLVVPEINDRVPSAGFPRERISIPANLPLADPQFHMQREVDVLICAGTTTALFSIGQIDLSRDQCDLRIQKTQLGWVIVGGMCDASEESASCNLVELNRQLTRFCEVEECVRETPRSQDDVGCEEHYVNNTVCNSEGRYVVRLPFKTDGVEFGNSKQQALRRLGSLQRRFASDTQLRDEYGRVLQDYLEREREHHEGACSL